MHLPATEFVLHCPAMSTHTDAPLALVGYPATTARAFRELGFTAMSVPTDHAREVAAACQTLKFSGALIAPAYQKQWLEATHADHEARRVGRVDAAAFPGLGGAPQGTFAYADALADTLSASGYAAHGASALILGQSASDLAIAAPLLRQGFSDIGLAADSAPEAEKAIRDLPVGLRIYPMTRRDDSLKSFADRADFVVVTAGSLPHGLLQPFHTLLDLTGQTTHTTSGATILSLHDLGAYHLSRQLVHATGQRLHPQELVRLAQMLHG